MFANCISEILRYKTTFYKSISKIFSKTKIIWKDNYLTESWYVLEIWWILLCLILLEPKLLVKEVTVLGQLLPNAKVGSLELTASSKGGGGVEHVDGKVPPINKIR